MLSRLLTNRIAIVLLAILATAAPSWAEARPNILFIVTDDQGPHAASYLGNQELPTPHLDRLAAEGAVLKNAFCVTPVCSPSRASMVTSRFGTELGILDWINPKTQTELGLAPQTTTWMELLQKNGYITGLMGKWHLGTAPRFHPTLTGYTEFMGFLDGGRPTKDVVLEIAGQNKQTTGFIVDIVTDGAIEFLKSHRSDTFALSVHYREPHRAWLPAPEEDVEPFKDFVPTLPPSEIPGVDEELVRQWIREYYISCRSVDRSVGRLLQTLKEQGLDENTIVIFTSDHGYNTGHHGIFHKGNASWMLKESPTVQWSDISANRRPNMFDQSLRVPAIVRWPKVVKPGTVIEHTVSHLDWYPTLLAMTDTAASSPDPVRGRSIVPLLKEQSIEWSDDLYSEYSMREGATVDMRCWRTPEWKLCIDFRHRDRDEMFDLQHDSAETTNLIRSDRRDVQEMRELLTQKIRAKMKEIGDPLFASLPQEPSESR